jgi:hypothetical protein
MAPIETPFKYTRATLMVCTPSGEYRELDPKPLPVMVKFPLTGTVLGLRLVTTGFGTSKLVLTMPTEFTPLTVTTSGPVVAAAGTVVTICESLQLEAVAVTPLKVTVLVPWVGWKFAPVIVTCVPGTPP